MINPEVSEDFMVNHSSPEAVNPIDRNRLLTSKNNTITFTCPITQWLTIKSITNARLWAVIYDKGYFFDQQLTFGEEDNAPPLHYAGVLDGEELFIFGAASRSELLASGMDLLTCPSNPTAALKKLLLDLFLSSDQDCAHESLNGNADTGIEHSPGQPMQILAIDKTRTIAQEEIFKGNCTPAAVGITNRYQQSTEDRLRQSEDKYRQLFENMTAGFALHEMIYDNLGSPVDYRFLEINPAFEKLTGSNASSWIGKTVKEVLPNTEPYWIDVYGQVANTGQSLSYTNYAKDLGKYYDVWAFSPVKGKFAVIFTDVTEHKQMEQRLRESKEYYKQLIATSPDGIITTDINGLITYASPRAGEMVALPAAESGIGRAVVDFMAPEEHPQYRQLVQDIITGKQSTSPHEHHLVKVDGTRFWGDVSSSPIIDANGNVLGIMSIIRDISERKQAQEEIKKHCEHLQALQSIDRAIIYSFDLRHTMEVCIEQVTTQLNVDAVSILRLNTQTALFEHISGQGFRTNTINHNCLRMGDNYAGRAALERRTIYIKDLAEEEVEFGSKILFEKEGFRTYYGIPLIVKGQLTGVMEIFFRTVFEPEQDWSHFLDIVAGQIAIAVDNSLLLEKLQLSNMELEMAYDASLEGWSRALDLRDKETEGHTLRVAEMTVKIAHTLGLSEKEIAELRRGALLHDIGKMGIPDSILNKPTQLTAEEWEIMSKHPVYAYQLLYPIRYLRPVLDIPYCHHEKWDGSGYPRGLKGEQIPLSARVFAVVDVWDALCSTRPYRAAWPKAKAIEYIRAQAGTHFQPQVVEAFLKTFTA